jgi:mRNA interferase MazF
MKCGEIWTVSGGSGYAGKSRPAVIVQSDRFEETASVTVCLVTSDPADAPLLRIPILPNEENGLRAPSRLMADKITTIPKTKLGHRIGRLAGEDIALLNRALVTFLGIGAAKQR